MDPRFHTTRWSVVLAARGGTEPASREALSELCQTYWAPLYAFVRRRGHAPEEARDLTQSYFLRLLEKKSLKDVTPEAGRFRSFLLVSLKHYLANEWDRDRALKRGGGIQFIELDGEVAESRFRSALADHLTAEQVFERRWALEIIERSIERLRAEFEGAGKLERFEGLLSQLTGDDERTYRELADQLGMTEGALRVAIHRMRQRIGELLREEVAQTLVAPGDVESEIRHLLSVVGAPPRGP